jgi:branched-chain amino acid transport system substrate-binding protein
MYLKNRSFPLAVRVLCASIFCLLNTACNPIPDTIKIGVAMPLTGPLASQGNDLLNGAKLAVQHINAQGLQVNGKSVQLQIVQGDDQSNPEVGKRVARDLVEDGVVAVIGHLNSGVSIPAAPIYASQHIAQLSMSTKPEYTRLGLPTTLRLIGNDKQQSKTMGSYAVQHMQGKVFALVDDGTPFGKNLANLVATELDKQAAHVTLRRSLDNKSTQFSNLIAELKAHNVDTYITTQADFQVAALCQQLAQAGLTHLQILGADNIKTEALANTAQRMRAIYATSPIIEAPEFKASAEFLPKFRAAFKSNPTYAAHYTYDAVHVVVAAIKRTESVVPKKITEALKTIDALAPVTNNIRFRPDGEQYYPVISVYKLARGMWEPMTRSTER